MTKDKGKPAKFIIRNSKGYPDFLMTMLTVVTVALLVLLLFWICLNILAFRDSKTQETDSGFVQYLQSFNENSRIMVLGICSSIFSFAGAYYLRRQSYDKHYESMKQMDTNLIQSTVSGIIIDPDRKNSFLPPSETKRQHPNYDDEGEDI